MITNYSLSYEEKKMLKNIHGYNKVNELEDGLKEIKRKVINSKKQEKKKEEMRLINHKKFLKELGM